MLQLTTTVQLHQVKANCNTNINILSIDLCLFAMEIIYHSHYSLKARGKESSFTNINMPKRKLKPKASVQWKQDQSTNRKSINKREKHKRGNYEHHPKDTPQKA
ncbi:hypothetical protein SO802_019077 [Lithocarpus litseifolius]|uniref:Uncharacterized protein n=1 Tax=Lithocarpus litseifolius TaxID=425828 RepID=A0AAW2CMQ8_9ROSI